ncbi:hypothetical protein DSLASN_44170 [Desulfoluna limicola]|uniref:Secreted protein n=1 Tax=Desulfoluna limicola TaxID=2810562 RepID=A0ABM7PMM9_9BACT|nr:hypothetical protein [Desulfoluna limicola]BCS98785.1 hypothetical protein DSLASN_44170 [Desulfoluna limicola]
MTQKVALICLAVLLGTFGGAYAADSLAGKELPAAFDHLEEVVRTNTGAPDAKHLDTLLTFLAKSPVPGTVWREDRKDRETGVGVTFKVPASLSRFIQYMYDPEIPVSAVVPGVVRLVRDVEGEEHCKESYARLREADGGSDTPIVVRSHYTMEVTPDDNSGAYYGYAQNEVTVLSAWQGRRYLMTVSRQTAPSDVGKKGYPVTTRDGGTIYCYSGKKGLTKPGLGWVDSFIYTSLAITVYLEDAPGAGSMTAVSYKWLNAGWMGKNMVREHHIAVGIERFGEHLGRFLTSPNVPDPQGLVALVRRLDAGEEKALKGVLEKQLATLVEPRQKGASMMGRSYVETLDHEELVAGILSTYVESLMVGGDPESLSRMLEGVGMGGDPLLTGRTPTVPTKVPAGNEPALN